MNCRTIFFVEWYIHYFQMQMSAFHAFLFEYKKYSFWEDWKKLWFKRVLCTANKWLYHQSLHTKKSVSLLINLLKKKEKKLLQLGKYFTATFISVDSFYRLFCSFSLSEFHSKQHANRWHYVLMIIQWRFYFMTKVKWIHCCRSKMQ